MQSPSTISIPIAQVISGFINADSDPCKAEFQLDFLGALFELYRFISQTHLSDQTEFTTITFIHLSKDLLREKAQKLSTYLTCTLSL